MAKIKYVIRVLTILLSVMCAGLILQITVQFRKRAVRDDYERWNNIHSKDLDSTSVKKNNIVSFSSRCKQNQLYRFHPSNSGDVTRMSMSLIGRSTRCPRQLQRFNSTLPRTWLLSTPGSGNTWTRHLVQELTGFCTGSLYNDGVLRKNGFPCEGEVSGVIAIKTHSLWAISVHSNFEVSKETDRLIFVIRNPYFSLLSHFKENNMAMHHTKNARIPTESAKWKKFIANQVSNWRRNVLLNLQSDLNKLVLFYEDMATQLLPVLIRMAKFLRSDALTDFGFCCALAGEEGHNHRKASRQNLDDVYTPEDRQHINDMLTGLAETIASDFPHVSSRILSYVNTV